MFYRVLSDHFAFRLSISGSTHFTHRSIPTAECCAIACQLRIPLRTSDPSCASKPQKSLYDDFLRLSAKKTLPVSVAIPFHRASSSATRSTSLRTNTSQKGSVLCAPYYELPRQRLPHVRVERPRHDRNSIITDTTLSCRGSARRVACSHARLKTQSTVVLQAQSRSPGPPLQNQRLLQLRNT
jgi:hypothetical protein